MGCRDEKQQEPARRAPALLAKEQAVAANFNRGDFANCITDSSGPKGMQFAEASASCEPTPANRASSSSGSQPADVLPAAVSKASIAHDESNTVAKKTKQEAPCHTPEFSDTPASDRKHAGQATVWNAQEKKEAWREAARLEAEELKAEEARTKLARTEAQLAVKRRRPCTEYGLIYTEKLANIAALRAEKKAKAFRARSDKRPECTQGTKEQYTKIKRAKLEMEKDKAAKDQGLFLYYTIQYRAITYSTLI